MNRGVTVANERLKMAKERLNTYYGAELRVLAGQSYTIGTKTLTRANLSEIRRAIKELENQVGNLSSGGKRVMRRLIPRDF